MLTEPVINLLLQIPLAGVVAFVVWMFLKHLRQSEERQDNAQTRMIEFLGTQEENNRLFMREQNEIHAAGMARMADEVKNISLEVNNLSSKFHTLVKPTPKRNRNT